jgi:hypothetical protein
MYDVDNVSNTITSYSSTFTANTGTNDITPTTDPLFGVSGYPSGLNQAGVPVRFTTTGTLPSPLLLNTDYYLSPTTSGKYEIYPSATSADTAILGTNIEGENILPAQHYFEKINKIVLTDIGSGTHTVTRENLLSLLVDSKNGYNMSPPSTSNRHAHLIQREDGYGDKYLYTQGGCVKNNLSGWYNIYGKTLQMKANRSAAYQERALKRYVWSIFVCKTRKIKTRNVKKHKVNYNDFNLSTGVVTLSVRNSEEKGIHKFATGNKVKFKLLDNATLPAVFNTTSYYFVRKIASYTFTLHNSLEDAQGSINPIIPSALGTGSYMLYAPTLVGQTQVFNDYMEFLDDNGGNCLTIKDNNTFLGADILVGTDFIISGSTHGEVNRLGASDLDLLRLWTPPETTLPAQLINEGLYYVTKKPGSATTCRLHSTLQDAIDSVGLATNHVNFKGIKVTSQPVGELYFYVDDGKSRIILSLEAGSPNGSTGTIITVPYEQKQIIFTAIDYNPTVGTNSIAYAKVNRNGLTSVTTGRAKGLTDVAATAEDPWTFFNSAQGHVPVDMDLYAVAIGASATDALTETQIQNMMNWYADKYTIPGY